MAFLAGFVTPVEEWPVANPVAPVPAVLVVGPREPVLVVAAPAACVPDGPATIVYRSYDARERPAPASELRAALTAAIARAGLEPGAVAVDDSLPESVAAVARAAGLEPFGADERLAEAFRRPDDVLLEAIKRAAAVADAALDTLCAAAEPGRSEAEIAGEVHAAMTAAAGRRVPTILTVTAGPASGGRAGRRRRGWSSRATSSSATRRHGSTGPGPTSQPPSAPAGRARPSGDASAPCKAHSSWRWTGPGALGRDVDRLVREHLAEHGPTYGHHTGHGVGVRWWQEPYITPYGDRPIEEGMVLAVEPALYDPALGGIRLEQTFVVAANGNEPLTRYAHRLTR